MNIQTDVPVRISIPRMEIRETDESIKDRLRAACKLEGLTVVDTETLKPALCANQKQRIAQALIDFRALTHPHVDRFVQVICEIFEEPE